MTTANRLAGQFPTRTGGRGRGAGTSGRADGGRARAGGTTADRVATFLGWFSIGLGLTEVLVPGELARFIGMKNSRANRGLLRFYGLRELGAGVGILSRPRPAGWVWARVAGDAVDLATLGAAMASEDSEPDRLLVAMLAVGGVTALDIYDAIALGQQPTRAGGVGGFGTVELRRAITIGRPVGEIYGFWRDFRNLPRFMRHLKSVEDLGDGRSRWTAEAPLGGTVSWEAEVIGDRADEQISWQSVPGSHVHTTGTVRFVPAPGGQGTEVHVEMSVTPPGGPLGAVVAKLFGESPDRQVHDDLRILKQILETGEVVLSEGSFDGTRMRQRPAQPPEHVPAEAMGR